MSNPEDEEPYRKSDDNEPLIEQVKTTECTLTPPNRKWTSRKPRLLLPLQFPNITSYVIGLLTAIIQLQYITIPISEN